MKLNILILVIYTTILSILQHINTYNFDSHVNHYFDTKYEAYQYKDIANSTWKELAIADKLNNLVKCIPTFIDEDKELDLLVLDSETRLYWVSNVRGTSGNFHHKTVSHSKLLDFVIHGSADVSREDFFILGISSDNKRILKYNSYIETKNKSILWTEETFVDFTSDDFYMGMLKDCIITGLNLLPFDTKEQYLFLTAKNVYTQNTKIVKINVINQVVKNIIIIEVKDGSRIVGAYDLNKDGYADLVYIDERHNLYCLVNNDPYYYSVYLSTINSIYDNDILPRIFIRDSDEDSYPDIITANSIDNSIGLLFNPGYNFWERIKVFYQQNNYDNSKIFNEQVWTYIPLFNIYEYNLFDKKIKDFTVLDNKPSYDYSLKRINFEIFVVYEHSLYWFVEKNLNITMSPSIWGSAKKIQRNFIYCMIKSDIIIDKINQEEEKEQTYSNIISTDINFDAGPEFIVYAKNSLFLLKRYTPYLTGFGWNSSFWIYVCLYIFIIGSIIGMIEFYKLNQLNSKILREKLLKTSNKNVNDNNNDYNENDDNVNENNVNIDNNNSQFNSNNIKESNRPMNLIGQNHNDDDDESDD